MIRLLLTAVIFCRFLSAATVDPAAAAILSVTGKDTVATVPVEFVGQKGTAQKMRGIEIDGRVHISAYRLARLINGTCFWKEETKKMIVRIGAVQVKLTGGNRVVGINNKMYLMPRPVRYRMGTLYLPAEDFVHLYNQHLPGNFTWTEGTRRLAMASGIHNINHLEIAGNVISLYLAEELPYEKSISEPNWLHLSFNKGQLAPAVSKLKKWDGIREIKTYQFNGAAQISFLFPSSVRKFDTSWDAAKKCLKIAYGAGVKKPEEITKNETVGYIDCIVIDAGHGGRDPGAVGPTGLKEKEVVLDIAKRLAAQIKRKTGIKVVLTRDDDTFIPLRRRTAIANKAGAKLFVSIHANANRSRKAKGFETYFLAQEKNDEARLVAAMENSAIKWEQEEDPSESMTNLDFIMWDMVQNEFAKESQEFAVMIQDDLGKRLNNSNRGVKQARFYVLNGAFMPNVLVEVGFISNPYEEKQLRKRKFRQKLADSLFSSIIRFKKKFESSM